ncbi:hypothetical protein GIY30_24160 [Gordonia sp. HNM0687]|uniref:Uncharacterized protein n=1 Tax=Gordonia mangrovi TaxID=2665643 RepID=A0A6L7GWP4_9ACTN|nr:hypothetical protein [Gordonia mangrovi]MDY6807740.1 hypothetical protein [Actinomycetota bacterium]MXP24419.1 hypothetical protein [Gordonia mangrovi]UVF79965.1 hypothetical protein NWF22_09155 [Gordonia mangrovi]
MVPTSQPATEITATFLTGFAVFQTALAAGAPWGAASYGGGHAGRLPMGLRRLSGVAAVVYTAGAGALVARLGDPGVRRRALTGLTGVMAAGTVMNTVSRSPVERVWGPVCAATAVAAWRARSEQVTSRMA